MDEMKESLGDGDTGQDSAGAVPQAGEQQSNTAGDDSANSGGGSILSGAKPPEPAAPVEPSARYDLKIPDGMYPPEQIAEAEARFREMGLDNASAQKLIDMSVAGQQKAQTQHTEQVQKWADEVRADKELGGSQLDATVMYAKAGLQRFDTDGAVFSMLESTGYANHPAILRMLVRIGRELGEDGIVTGKGEKSALPLEDRLFKNMKV